MIHCCLSLTRLVFQEIAAASYKCATRSCKPIDIEESTSSYRSKSPNLATQNGKLFRSSSIDEVAVTSDFAASGSKCIIDVTGNLLHEHADLKCHASGDKHDVSVAHIILVKKYPSSLV